MSERRKDLIIVLVALRKKLVVPVLMRQAAWSRASSFILQLRTQFSSQILRVHARVHADLSHCACTCGHLLLDGFCGLLLGLRPSSLVFFSTGAGVTLGM